MASSNEPCPRTLDDRNDSSSITSVTVLKYSHKWTIHNFSHCLMNPGTKIDSATFSSKIYHQIRWCLTLFPFGLKPASNPALYLTLLSSYKAEIGVFYRFYILNKKGERTNLRANGLAHIVRQQKNDFEPQIGLDSWFERDYLMNEDNGLLLDDTLTILCEIDASTVIPIASPLSCNGRAAVEISRPEDKLTKFYYTWTINQFSYRPEFDGLIMESPEFTNMDDSVANLTVKIRLRSTGGENSPVKNWITAKLVPSPKVERYFDVAVQFFIIDSEFKKTNKIGVIKSKFTHKNGPIAASDWIKKTDLFNNAETLLPNDTLTILCEIAYMPSRGYGTFVL